MQYRDATYDLTYIFSIHPQTCLCVYNIIAVVLVNILHMLNLFYILYIYIFTLTSARSMLSYNLGKECAIFWCRDLL